VSSAPCLLDSDCIQLTLDGSGNLVADVIISPDDGNTLSCQPNGLFSASSVIPEAAALPSSPVDGQMFVYEVNPSCQWLFRYDADESTIYKWKFIGGGVLYNNDDTELDIASPDGNWHTGSPVLAVTVPFAGYYSARYGANINPAEDGKFVKVGVANVGDDPNWWASNANARVVGVASESLIPLTSPAGDLRWYYQAETHDGPNHVTIDKRWLSVWPRKVG
jgi:hypothetical protein